MNEMSPFTNEAEQLGRRREMAIARKTREAERTSLLQKLVRTERQATQLREWIAQRKVDDAPPSEVQRMVEWAQARLSAIEEFLNPLALSRQLHTRNLFPEVDDLVDPLGEPPPLRPWGR
jgi:16S rRNA C967 or C1407 C5-methylase (RsmB/RsmF family)